MSETGSLCERLDWDSRFFGVSIAKAVPTRVDTDTCLAVLDWCRAEKIDCLYFLAADDPEARQVLEGAAFVRVDERVTIELQPMPPAPALPADTRRARDSDIAALREIAGRAH